MLVGEVSILFESPFTTIIFMFSNRELGARAVLFSNTYHTKRSVDPSPGQLSGLFLQEEQGSFQPSVMRGLSISDA